MLNVVLTSCYAKCAFAMWSVFLAERKITLKCGIFCSQRLEEVDDIDMKAGEKRTDVDCYFGMCEYENECVWAPRYGRSKKMDTKCA